MLGELSSGLIFILAEGGESEYHLMRKLSCNRWGWGTALSIDHTKIVRHVVTSHQANRTTSFPQSLRYMQVNSRDLLAR